MAKGTLIAGLTAIALGIALAADSYYSPFFLRYPPFSIFSGAFVTLLLAAVLTFLGLSVATLVRVVLGREPPRSLLAIIPPPIVFLTLIFSSPNSSWLERAAPTVTASASEAMLLAFAGEARKTTSETRSEYTKAPPTALEQLPPNMRTADFLSDRPPLVHVDESYVIVVYGAPRVGWGLVITDKLSKEIPADQAVEAEHYKRIYPRVWIFDDNLHRGFDAIDDFKTSRPNDNSAPAV